jgi:VCBS repeat-containing protein
VVGPDQTDGLITILSGNTPPVAANDTFGVNEDQVLNVPAPGVLANDTDADANPLTALLVSNAAQGTLLFNANGSFTYTPTPNFNGADGFTYKANDGQADSNVATVSLNITPVNDAPQGTDTTVTTLEDTPYTFGTADFGFTDPNDSPANNLSAVKITTLPGTGSLTDNGTAVSAGHPRRQRQWPRLRRLHLPGAGQWRHGQRWGGSRPNPAHPDRQRHPGE